MKKKLVKVKETVKANAVPIIIGVASVTGICVMIALGKRGSSDKWKDILPEVSFDKAIGDAKYLGKGIEGKVTDTIVGLVDNVSLSALGDLGAEVAKHCEVPTDTTVRIMFADMKNM